MKRAHLVVTMLGVVVAAGAGCEIANTDPLPDIGATCIVSDPKCGVDHTCRPAAGADEGLCAPILSFGTCPAPKHPPGREGTDEEREVVEIDDAADIDLLGNVRSISGQLRVFRQGGERVAVDNLCGLSTLQRVGNGLAVGDLVLSNLDGLQSITSVGNGLAVFDNQALTSLDALGNLVDVGTRTIEIVGGAEVSFDLAIVGNGDLPDDVVDAFIADLEARSGRDYDVVACNNQGRACAGNDLAIAQLIVATGGRGED